MIRLVFISSVLLFLSACSNDKKAIKNLVEKNNVTQEVAENVEIFYSDSAVVKVRIKSPKLIRYSDQGEYYDEFPDGLLVEFLNQNKRVTSWLEADYALRKDVEKKIFVKDNVRLFNKDNDELYTDELIWDENNEEIYTYKAVKINQPSQGDTSFGIGFRADQEFTKFSINKYTALKNIEKFKEEFEDEKESKGIN